MDSGKEPFSIRIAALELADMVALGFDVTGRVEQSGNMLPHSKV
jgi:hypothetical protein